MREHLHKFGTQEDKDDFVVLSDTYLSSLHGELGNEDDIKKIEMVKEDDQKVGVDDDVSQVSTILTPPRMGHGDLMKSPGMGQEEGEDDRNVPDNITSSTTSGRWVEGTTINSDSTTHHKGGGEYGCCVDQSSIARRMSLDNRGDGVEPVPLYLFIITKKKHLMIFQFGRITIQLFYIHIADMQLWVRGKGFFYLCHLPKILRLSRCRE